MTDRRWLGDAATLYRLNLTNNNVFNSVLAHAACGLMVASGITRSDAEYSNRSQKLKQIRAEYRASCVRTLWWVGYLEQWPVMYPEDAGSIPRWDIDEGFSRVLRPCLFLCKQQLSTHSPRIEDDVTLSFTFTQYKLIEQLPYAGIYADFDKTSRFLTSLALSAIIPFVALIEFTYALDPRLPNDL